MPHPDDSLTPPYDLARAYPHIAAITNSSLMTSWHGNVLHITGPVWGESTTHSQRVSNAEISRFLRCQVAQEQLNITLRSHVWATPFGYGQVVCPAVFPTQFTLLPLTVASQL